MTISNDPLRQRAKTLKLYGLLTHWEEIDPTDWIEPLIHWEEQERAMQVGQKKPRMTLARDIQRDVIKLNYLHVDFYAVKMDEKVTAGVPLVLIGVAPAVIEEGGILTQGLDELEIECLPSDLIAAIEVNVEDLVDFNKSISVTDLVVPRSITILSDPESMVAKVEPPRLVEEEEEEVLEEEELISVEPEVLTEAKEKEQL